MIEPTICKIAFFYRETRRKPQAGDVKVSRGRTLVRQQVLTRDGYHLRRNCPVFEWVPEEEARSTYRTGWVQPKRKSKA